MFGAHFGNFRGRVRSSISLLFFLLTAAVWLEPGSCISLHHQNYESHRAPREAGTDLHSLQFDLLTDTTAECVERLGSNVYVELSYRTPSGDWETLRLLTRVPGDCDSVSHRETVQLPPDIVNQTAIQFRWLQQEQAWHDCNCWQISDVSLTVNNSQLLSYFGDGANDLNNDFACADSQASTGQLSCFTGGEGLVFCDGSASVPRGVVTPMYDLSTGGIVSGSCTASNLFEPIGDVQLCAPGAEGTFIDVSFQLDFHNQDSFRPNRLCNLLDSLDEGVELAIRRSEDEQWVPLKFYTTVSSLRRRDERINIGRYDQDNSILSLRGYNVSVVAGDTSVMSLTVNICDERFFQEGIQFRWLQTVLRVNGVVPTARDSWFIDNVEITVFGSQNSSRTEFSDDFSAQFICETLWPQVQGGVLGRTASIGTNCVPEDSGGVLFFGTSDTLPDMSETQVAVTRIAVMKPLNLVPEINECAEGRDDCDENVVYTVCGQVPSEILQMFADLFDDTADVCPSVVLSTLRDMLGNLPTGSTFPLNTSQLLLDSLSDLIDTVQQSDSDTDNTRIGSTLLYVLDRFALGPYDPEQGELEGTSNIALVHMVLSTSDGDSSDQVEVIAINGNRIVLPREVFMNCNAAEVSVASYFYRNLSGLLPDSLPGDSQNSATTMKLNSSVLSSALQCGSMQFDTRNLNLTNPVVITFSHPQGLEQQDGRTTSFICVFWEFDDFFTTDGLISGQWSTEGCTRNDTASSESQTVCECNHLTHFALLLSTTEISLTTAEALSLRKIAVICVTISLVCFAATIFTFIFLKSLWNMRNYIHVNLCASLFVAQLTFIVAVEPRGSVVGCQATAVLLHYFFLVTFMWMLMEGVVLYVILVRVFIDATVRNRYIIAFTIASYGIPLLYLGITVPLGFALDNGPHYAGDDPQSCWLRYDTHFIWAFIAPVIVIILTNIGFFIMAITVMYRHRQQRMLKSKDRYWLKASISLVIIMGITWIIGILVFNRDLLFVAYIYTIFIGLQGLVIFLLFVVLVKQVREAYTKWWKVKVASSDFLSRHFGEKSYTSQTAMTPVSFPLDKDKSLDKHVPPHLGILHNSHNSSPLRGKENNSVLDAALIQGPTSVSSDQTGGEAAKDAEKEET